MTPELQTRINQLVHDGDAASLIWMFEGQLRIDAQLYTRIAELESENAALRAFVRVCDDDERRELCIGESLHYQKSREALRQYETGGDQ